MLGTSTVAPCQELTAYESLEPYAPHPASNSSSGLSPAAPHTSPSALPSASIMYPTPRVDLYAPDPRSPAMLLHYRHFSCWKASWLRGPRGVGGSKYESRCWEETFSLEVADVGCLCRSFSCESQRRRSSRFVAITSGPVPASPPCGGGPLEWR